LFSQYFTVHLLLLHVLMLSSLGFITWRK